MGRVRVFWFLWILTVLGLCPLTVWAQTPVELPELGVRVEVPDDWACFTRDEANETLSLAFFGMDTQELWDYFQESGAYLDCVAQGQEYEMILFAEPTEDGNFGDWATQDRRDLLEWFIENDGYDNGTIQTFGDVDYIRLTGADEDAAENGYPQATYYTCINGVDLYYSLYCTDAALLVDFQTQVETMLQTAEYIAPEAAIDASDAQKVPSSEAWDAGIGLSAAGLILLVAAEAACRLGAALALRLIRRRPFGIGLSIGIAIGLNALFTALGFTAKRWTGGWAGDTTLVVWIIFSILILAAGRRRPLAQKETEEGAGPRRYASRGPRSRAAEDRDLPNDGAGSEPATGRYVSNGPVGGRPAAGRYVSNGPVNRPPAAADGKTGRNRTGNPRYPTIPVSHEPGPRPTGYTRCPDCGYKAPAGTKICPKCGSELYYYHKENEE